MLFWQGTQDAVVCGNQALDERVWQPVALVLCTMLGVIYAPKAQRTGSCACQQSVLLAVGQMSVLGVCSCAMSASWPLAL
jgi:hypothetical protein